MLENHPDLAIRFLFSPVRSDETKVGVQVENGDREDTDKIILSMKILDEIGRILILRGYFWNWPFDSGSN